jgi:TetR/AcrR family transcriptional regulator, regulator of cefoperazone and chloramphenicol sensitivity
MLPDPPAPETSPPTAQPPAPPRPGAHPRGEDTRLRILRTALEVFAAEGYEGASTRLLARRAGVNLPAIQYYFGSKEGLYSAVVDHIAERMETRMAPVTAEIRAALAEGAPSRADLLGLLLRMLDAFVELIMDRESPDWESRALFFARAEIESAAALEPLYQRVMRRIVEPCAALVGHLLERPADDPKTLLHAVAVLGQVTIFCNRKTQRVLGGQADACACPAGTPAIQAVVREHTAAIFKGAVSRGAVSRGALCHGPAAVEKDASP